MGLPPLRTPAPSISSILRHKGTLRTRAAEQTPSPTRGGALLGGAGLRERLPHPRAGLLPGGHAGAGGCPGAGRGGQQLPGSTIWEPWHHRAPAGSAGSLPAPRQRLPGLETPRQCSANILIPTSQEGVNSRLLGFTVPGVGCQALKHRILLILTVPY